MGKDLVSNQNRVIATKGTAHVPRTAGPTDTCLNPANGATAPFENHAPMSTLKGHTTVTKIAGDPIWIKPAQVGPTTLPPHPPFVIGAASGQPYQMEARSTSNSPDVYSEGSPVIRTNDTTTQNKCNTVGFVDGSQVKVGEGLSEALAKKKCAFTYYKGLVGVSGKRPLGWPGKASKNDAYYLEILSGSEVELTSMRVDVTQAVLVFDPVCQLEPKHTLWEATRAGGGEASASKTGSGKKFVLDPGFTLRTNRLATMAGVAPGTKNTASLGEAPDRTVKPGTKVSESASASLEGAGSSMLAAYELWKFRKGPAIIAVQAKACAGIKTAQIRVFPKEQVKVSISVGAELERQSEAPKVDAFVASIRDKVKMVRKLADIAQNVVKLKSGATMNVKLCVGFSMGLELGYKECKEEKETRFRDLKTPAHCGLAWKLAIASDPLIDFNIKLTISLLEIVGPYLAAAAAVMRKFDVKADIEFKAGASLALSISVGVDEYDWPTNTGGEAVLTPYISGELVVAATSKAKLVNAGLSVSGEIKPGIFLSDKRDYTAQVKLGGGVKTKLWFTLFKDSFLEYSKSVEPEALKWEPKGLQWDVGKMPSS